MGFDVLLMMENCNLIQHPFMAWHHFFYPLHRVINHNDNIKYLYGSIHTFLNDYIRFHKIP